MEGKEGVSKLTLDLHEIFNRGRDIDRALREVLRKPSASRRQPSREFLAKAADNSKGARCVY
jgi:hypothetical protein